MASKTGEIMKTNIRIQVFKKCTKYNNSNCYFYETKCLYNKNNDKNASDLLSPLLFLLYLVEKYSIHSELTTQKGTLKFKCFIYVFPHN